MFLDTCLSTFFIFEICIKFSFEIIPPFFSFVVLTGKDRKKEGEVIEIDRSSNRAKVKDINIVKKHVKTTKEKKGGIISKENFIHLSNLKLVENNTKKKKTGVKK